MILQQSYSTAWESPSNIALVKYWGKFGRQYPSNPSISFTLSEAKSSLSMKVSPADSLSCRLEFHGQRETAFEERIFQLSQQHKGRLSLARARLHRHAFHQQLPALCRNCLFRISYVRLSLMLG